MLVMSSSIAMGPSTSEAKLFSSNGSKLALADILLGFPALLLGLHMEARSARILQKT